MQISKEMAAIVTGGASGLGEATARALASAGAKVTVFDMNEERGPAVARELDGTFAKVDVSSGDSVSAGLEIARAAHGQERIVVNCAGIAIGERTASIDKKTGEARFHALESFQKTIAVNLTGTFNMISKCAAGMIAAEPVTADGGRGVIVNTASIAGVEGRLARWLMRRQREV
jgi:NAD(P)-dependent dehydrogenase (short-subunit alcohol dehydrogenase family)